VAISTLVIRKSISKTTAKIGNPLDFSPKSEPGWTNI